MVRTRSKTKAVGINTLNQNTIRKDHIYIHLKLNPILMPVFELQSNCFNASSLMLPSLDANNYNKMSQSLPTSFNMNTNTKS